MPSIVAARSLNNVIGNGPDIPWKVKGEQKLFREITMNGTLVMGRKTFESIGRPLPGRTTIIISRQRDYHADGCIIVHDLDEALETAAQENKPVFIAGGGEIYRQSLDRVDAVHLSTIQTTVEGDVFFPDFPTSEFRLVREQAYESNINYLYQYYERRKP
ncbi:MAG: dihydrofolate reductase [Pseudomonadales bacterium]|nr:dihydrofolate reductase [Pseudomonadales bacterium]